MTEHRATRLLYHATEGEPAPGGPLDCWFCGGPCPESAPLASTVVRSTFSDMARAAYDDGDGPICPACVHYLDYKILRPGQKRAMGLFTKAVIVWDDPPELAEWLREDLADQLIRWTTEGLGRPAFLALNYSKQKHVLPWARRNEHGTRILFVATDIGETLATPYVLRMMGAVAELWRRGHPKGLIARAELAQHVLARSASPADELALVERLRPYAGAPLMDLATYAVTEDNRDRIAGQLSGLLPGHGPAPAAGGAARGARESRGGPGVQEPVSPAVVGHSRGACAALGHDERQPHELEQRDLFSPQR